MIDTKAIRALCERATPGPWDVTQKGNTVKSMAIKGVCSGMSAMRDDYQFIAQSREIVPALLDALEAAHTLIRQQTAEMQRRDQIIKVLDAAQEAQWWIPVEKYEPDIGESMALRFRESGSVFAAIYKKKGIVEVNLRGTYWGFSLKNGWVDMVFPLPHPPEAQNDRT